MIKINENYKKLQASYLFSDIARKVAEYQKNNPSKEIIKMGIGDVTRPLPEVCVKAMHKAVDDLTRTDTFRGYGPEQGYEFLREPISEFDFKSRGADISPDEIFISDGAKCDTGNIQEIFSDDAIIALPDPVYPVYSDTNVMSGRSGNFKNGRYENFIYLDSTDENNFIPELPSKKPDVIYLCFPNNPTGATATKEQLKKWVDYARENKALILFDAAYESFVRDESLPRSIFEIEGAREVAIEFRSFSKTAGFTGVRCAYIAIPKDCRGWDSEGNIHSMHTLWNRRHNTKFNGASYPVQKAASAVFTAEGQKEVREITDFYLENARIIRESMVNLGYKCTGGVNSPYIWVKTDTTSWDFFDSLLGRAGVVCTPGSGFGLCGEGYIRFSAFNTRENTEKAMERIAKFIK
ncbi:MAG: LL-diaminopimelate aminotransferase [Spirochaetia bacterium]|jgi:LL-diaminopimelate aminotransferase|nr:LL-diaminopimelate aminotransferase [Spirochaetia bacterium]